MDAGWISEAAAFKVIFPHSSDQSVEYDFNSGWNPVSIIFSAQAKNVSIGLRFKASTNISLGSVFHNLKGIMNIYVGKRKEEVS